MDWTAVLTIILSITGILIVFLVFILNRMDSGFSELRNEIQYVRKDLTALDKQFTRIEDRLEFSNKVIYIQHEEKKEESK